MRWLPDGELEYLGRDDQQVKVHGYRIELEEIESVLRDHPRIADAAVTVVSTSSGGQFLVALVAAAPASHDGGTGEPPPPDIVAAARRQVANTLPPHMLPHHYQVVPDLPLHPSGKLDRQALKAMARPSIMPGGGAAPGTGSRKACSRS